MITIAEARYGFFLVHDTDMYVGRSLLALGEFGEGQVDLFRQLVRPGMVVCDVGANIGAHTVAFARMGAVVHAFEPQRDVFHMLCGNVALNGLMDVYCHHVAIGQERARVRVARADTGVENNLGAFSLDLIDPAGVVDEIEVITLETRCDFLKIDVEGWELEVLRGAEPMIRECAPILYLENDRPDRADELIGAVRDLGYSPYWHVTPMFNPRNRNGVEKSPWPDGVASIDMLCVRGIAIEGLTPAVEGGLTIERAA